MLPIKIAHGYTLSRGILSTRRAIDVALAC
jgi:hypothetical protein